MRPGRTDQEPPNSDIAFVPHFETDHREKVKRLYGFFCTLVAYVPVDMIKIEKFRRFGHEKTTVKKKGFLQNSKFHQFLAHSILRCARTAKSGVL